MIGCREKSLLELLDAMIEKYHLLKHPFDRAWSQGKLTKESLKLCAEQYYQHVREFPGNLKRLAGRTNGSLQELMKENLAEERDPSVPHPMLWRQFAQSLGVSEAALDAARPLPGIAALLDLYDEVRAKGSLAQAVAAFHAYEAQVPELAAQKISGLQRFHGIAEPRALAYFAVHKEADMRHRTAGRKWLQDQEDVDAVAVLCAAERSLKALWGALDAVYLPACPASH